MFGLGCVSPHLHTDDEKANGNRIISSQAKIKLAQMKTMKFVSLVLFPMSALMRLPRVTSELSDPSSVQVGDEICFEGFVMDTFCIDRGTLLDVRLLVSLLEQSIMSTCGQLYSLTLCISLKFYRTPMLSRSKVLISTQCTGTCFSSLATVQQECVWWVCQVMACCSTA